MKSHAFISLGLIVLLPLAACSQSPQNGSPAGATAESAQASKDAAGHQPHSMIAGKIHAAIQQAKQDLANKNIDVDAVHMGHGMHWGTSRSNAQITPQGELVVDGKQVAATPAQHRLLLDYRGQIVGIAEAGMDIGTQGADLGIQASKAAIWGALSGKSDKDIEASIKPQTDRIEAAALELCKRLPALLSSQQHLAAEMPAFRPYATMNQKDIDDCGKDTTDRNGKHGFAVFTD